MSLTKNDKRLILELERRARISSEILSSLFHEQREVLLDESRFKAVQCGRRSGKSYSAGSAFAYTANQFPACSMLFIAPTLKQAKRILFKDILKPINRQFKLGMGFNQVEGIASFPNGAVIYCMGADSSKEEADKILGQKFKLVIIDEGASYKNDLRHLIYYSIVPTLADLNGSLWLIGTTGNNTHNLFFDITGRLEGDPDKEEGWSIHKWNWDKNPHTCTQVQALINELKAKNPEIEKVSWFRQMYLNEWVIEDSRLCYKYNASINFAQELPADSEWLYSLSVDLGFEDDTAFTVGAWSSTDPNFYFVYTYRQKGLDITAVADVVRSLEKRFSFVKYVIDGAAKQSVEELRNRFGIPFVATDKRGKAEIIELMNADFVTGRIKVLPENEPLVEEWQNLIWDPNSSKRQEHPKMPNHCADSGLYNWRMSYHYVAREKIKEPPKDSDEYMDMYWKRVAKEAKEKDKKPWYRKLLPKKQRGLVI